MSDERGPLPGLPVAGGPAAGQFLGTLQQILQAINSQTAAMNALTAAAINHNWVAAPTHNTSPGVAGQVAYDSGFFYVCIATSSWARVAIGGTW